MAFSDQIEGITSLTISSSGTTPTNDEVSQFLVDGTRDVVNRIISIRPGDIMKFTVSTTDSSDAGVLIQGQIVGVVREHDSASILRPCSPMDSQNRYEVTLKDVIIDGFVTWWYENGQKKREVTYKDGKLFSSIYWNKDGREKKSPPQHPAAKKAPPEPPPPK